MTTAAKVGHLPQLCLTLPHPPGGRRDHTRAHNGGFTPGLLTQQRTVLVDVTGYRGLILPADRLLTQSPPRAQWAPPKSMSFTYPLLGVRIVASRLMCTGVGGGIVVSEVFSAPSVRFTLPTTL